MKNRNTKIIIAFIIILLLATVAFWFFFLRITNPTIPIDENNPQNFSPFGTSTRRTNNGQNNGQSNGTSTSSNIPIPILRLLSSTPVGGYGASTTASTTIIRWVDRGRGSILQATEDSLDIIKLSNTLAPRIYQSAWNKSLNAFISTTLVTNSTRIQTTYIEITPVANMNASSTNSMSITPFELKGKNLPNEIVTYALSPKKDKIFFFSVQNNRGIGYISDITGGALTQIFDTPVTQVTIDWPEENTIAITTKGTASQDGFLYFVNPKTGVWKNIIGSIGGLSAIVSHDAKYVLISMRGPNEDMQTAIYKVASSTGISAVVRTLADKCAWGNFYKNLVYCAVPSMPINGTYPDDWYTGTIQFSDKIWQINASTGEVKLISNLFIESDRLIDGFNLSTDSKDNYLMFMSKNDLSLWSLNLIDSK